MSKVPLTHANIIKLLGVESLPMEDRQAIVENATELVETRVLARILGMLSDAKKNEFGKIVESADTDAVSRFFEENNIDYVALTEEEIEGVKQELLEVAKEA